MELELGKDAVMSNFHDVARALESGEIDADAAALACERLSSARADALAVLCRDVLWRRRISDEEADRLSVEGLRRRYYRVMGGAPYERATREGRGLVRDAAAFPAALAREMESCSMGATELASKLGVSRQVVYEYLHGDSAPSLATFCKACDALGCDPDDLLSEGGGEGGGGAC